LIKALSYELRPAGSSALVKHRRPADTGGAPNKTRPTVHAPRLTRKKPDERERLSGGGFLSFTTGTAGMNEQLLNVLRAEYCGHEHPELAPFVEHFRAQFEGRLLAVVFYGSRLDPAMATETSFYDFYLVCDDVKDLFPRWRDRRLLHLLPPNIYYLELPGEGEKKLACKYCVITLPDLKEQVGELAKDLYHLGRFSKRLQLLWWRDGFDRDEVLGCCLRAMETLLPHAVASVSNIFELPDLIRKALALSYEGEVRLEDVERKVESLYQAAPEFYAKIYGELLAEFRAQNREIFHEPEENDPPGMIYMRRSPRVRAELHEPTRDLLRSSRRRAVLRWPKNILLVDNWIDILLAKLERTYGVKLELTPRERRWILILGWRHYFRLRRQGRIH